MLILLCIFDWSYAHLIIFITGFLLTQVNVYGILWSIKEFTTLHCVGVVVGILMMGQAALT